jgi:hypothetical protein
MLPILRIIPVGGVLLAIMILVLSLSPNSGLNPGLAPTAMLARGALMQINEHPEWRQFLLLAATRRADEINRLRELQDEESVSANETTTATIPVEIGEKSSTELPLVAPVESLPVIRIQERSKPPRESRRKTLHQVRRAKVLVRTQPAPPVNGLDTLFGAPQTKPAAGVRTRTSLAPQATPIFDPAAQPSQADPPGTLGPH